MRDKLWITAFAVLCALALNAQENDSLYTRQLKDVVITSYLEKPIRQNSLHVERLDIDSLSAYGNFNLTDLMIRTPGVTMLSTGVGISKPVIRGLYGNRVLVLISGLKFDNQQWQDEHGMGLSDFGLDRAEMIKGPMSVFYGTEAMGGVINLIEEDRAKPSTYQHDYGLRFNSNSLGEMAQAGVKIGGQKRSFRLRLGAESHADYSDGNGNRVLNSRYNGGYLKSTFGFQKKRWQSVTNFMSMNNQYGFIFNGLYDFIQEDERWSRDLSENPSHLVYLNTLSSENKFELKRNSRIYFNLGVQSNQRKENEGGGAISLDMHLITTQYLLKYEKRLSEKNVLVISNLGSYMENINNGKRKIVPDATVMETNVSAYLETRWNQYFIWENGLGAGLKSIETKETATVNTAEKDIPPFEKTEPFYNFFTGVSLFPSSKFRTKLNVSTGVRMPNLAELSANGLHEGIYTYEIGNPDFENEQVLSFNGQFDWISKNLALNFSPYYNYFLNYVYLAPTDELWYGFPVYRYRQENAVQYGFESEITYGFFSKWNLTANYAGLVGKANSGEYLPFIPAQRINSNLSFQVMKSDKGGLKVYAENMYCFAQNKLAYNEATTPEYMLWNAGIQYQKKTENVRFKFSVAGNNLLNEVYYDHLSRLKNFGLYNIGRNISVNLSLAFIRNKQKLNNQ